MLEAPERIWRLRTDEENFHREAGAMICASHDLSPATTPPQAISNIQSQIFNNQFSIKKPEILKHGFARTSCPKM
jgi:hypothetical protein